MKRHWLLAAYPIFSAKTMHMNISLSVQVSHRLQGSASGATTGIFRRLRASLRRHRLKRSISRPIATETSNDIADDDSSWLGPPPMYDKRDPTRTFSMDTEFRSLGKNISTIFEDETMLTSATVTGPMTPIDLSILLPNTPPN